MPRSHLPELPDVTAQAILEQWKVDLIGALRRERSYRSSFSYSRRRSPEWSRSLGGSTSRYGSSRPFNPHSSASFAPSSRSPVAQTSCSANQESSGAPALQGTLAESSAAEAAATEAQIAEVVEGAPSTANGTDNSWRNAAWTVGSRLLYEALAALGREHTVRTEERQINMRLAAANAQQNQQLWTTVASWGAWSAHTALQYYFGSTRGSNHLLGNG